MGKAGFAFAALMASGSVSALDLTCDARFPTTNGEQRINTTIRIDTKSGATSMFTPGGQASGLVQETAEDFKGELVDANGLRSWLYVNRYDGTFVLAPIPTTDGAKARMWGTCAPAVQKF